MATARGTTNGKNSSDSDRLRADIDQLQKDIAALTDTMKDVAGSRGKEAVAQAREKAAALKDRGKEAADELGRQVSDKPLQSLGIAIGVGFLIGALLARR